MRASTQVGSLRKYQDGVWLKWYELCFGKGSCAFELWCRPWVYRERLCCRNPWRMFYLTYVISTTHIISLPFQYLILSTGFRSCCRLSLLFFLFFPPFMSSKRHQNSCQYSMRFSVLVCHHCIIRDIEKFLNCCKYLAWLKAFQEKILHCRVHCKGLLVKNELGILP